MADGKQLSEQPPIGMTPDGELVTIEPGQPIPQPKILTDDGEELTPEEADIFDKLFDKIPDGE